jgi:hypothetical protein
VYRDLHFPTRAHSSTACCSVPPSWPAGLPRPLHCTHLPPHTTHHSPHTTPHRARTTFGFECHASCPSSSPCPPPAARFLGRPCSHPAHEPCPCPRFHLLPLVVPLPLPPAPCPWPFPHCAFPSGSRAPFAHVHSVHVSSRTTVSPPVFPPTVRQVPKLNLIPPVPLHRSDTVCLCTGCPSCCCFAAISRSTTIYVCTVYR